MTAAARVFLLSPAHCGGERARLLFREGADFDLARRVRRPPGAPLGEVFAFLSGLYFRRKLAYAQAFACPPAGVAGVYVITPNEGLRPADDLVDLARLLRRDARRLAAALTLAGEVVLLGSVATGKYVDPLAEALGDRLWFPSDFVGRGDMSRGGLLLRCVRDGRELDYVAVAGAERRGSRPARLERRR